MGKKLLFIYYQNIKAGGVAKVLSNLANELVDKGYDVDILFLMAAHEDFYPLDSRIKKHYVDSFSYWTWSVCVFNKKNLRFIPKLQAINDYIYQLGVTLLMNKWLAKNQKNYDNIISCWYKLSCTLALNKNVADKTIAWEHTSHLVGNAVYNKLKRNYKNLDKVVVLNQDDYVFYRYINHETLIIGNMMGFETENQAFVSNQNKENLITMIARLEPEKNILEFLEIIKKANLPISWQIKIIGDGPDKDTLQNYISKNNLSNVFLLGQLDATEVQKILRKSKINCLTSLREGFGVVLIEAMFASNVLIAYDCKSGPSEIVNDNNGFLIPLKDQESFKEKLKYLLDYPQVLENLMKNSFGESKKWKKDTIINKWQSIL